MRIGTLALVRTTVMVLAVAGYSAGYAETYSKVSPFKAVRWDGRTPSVEVGSKWYVLTAINDVPVQEIVSFSEGRGAGWDKHFEEDLVELLTLMGHKPGPTVALTVRESGTGRVESLKDVPMTSENRQALWQARMASEKSGGPTTKPIGGVAWSGFPKLAPFNAVRWSGKTPEVLVGGKWYELLGINGVPVSRILSFADTMEHAGQPQRRFEEDLVELLARMGHGSGTRVSLEVKGVPSGHSETLQNVPMTKENRRDLIAARQASKRD